VTTTFGSTVSLTTIGENHSDASSEGPGSDVGRDKRSFGVWGTDSASISSSSSRNQMGGRSNTVSGEDLETSPYPQCRSLALGLKG